VARPPRSPKRRYVTGKVSVDRAVDALVAPHADNPSAEYARQLITTALKFLDDGTPKSAVRLASYAAKEMRYAAKVFAPFEAERKASIFGSARLTARDPSYALAVEVSRLLAEAGWMVITGAGPGIMQAGNEGAGRDRSFGVNIRLPFEQGANPAIEGSPRLITFKYFFVRKVFFVRESHAFVLFPGGYGTIDEGAEALTLIQTGKTHPVPVIMMEPPGGDYWARMHGFFQDVLRGRGLISPDDTSLYRLCSSSKDAVAEILGFYRNYHSARHLREMYLLRLQRPPDEAQLESLHRDFHGMLSDPKGRFEVVRGRALGEEPIPAPEPPWRLVFPFDKRSYGRLRLLIDRVNTW
jgi:uncharacterized protein (TIGR00730 family)